MQLGTLPKGNVILITLLFFPRLLLNGATFQMCGETYLFAVGGAWAEPPNLICAIKPISYGRSVGAKKPFWVA